MNKHDIIIGNEYELVYDIHNHKKVRVVSIDGLGDCTVQFSNNRKDVYHSTWLQEIEKEQNND